MPEQDVAQDEDNGHEESKRRFSRKKAHQRKCRKEPPAPAQHKPTTGNENNQQKGKKPKQLMDILASKVNGAGYRRMVVTMGAQGAVFAAAGGECGFCPARNVEVKDTTGAGDAFFAGVSIGLTYGKTLMESCEIGACLAASVVATMDSVCPRFLPGEFGLTAPEE